MKKSINALSLFMIIIILAFSLTACNDSASTEDNKLTESASDSKTTNEEAAGSENKPLTKQKSNFKIGIRSLGINYKTDGFSKAQNLTYFHSFGECFEISNYTYHTLLQDSKNLDGTQVRFYGATVFKVVKSDAKTFELLVCLEDNWDGNNQDYYNAVTNEEFLYVIGNYPENNEYEYQKGSSVGFCGKYMDLKKYEIDGNVYNIPGIMAFCEFCPAGDYQDVVLAPEEGEQITEYIFGKTALYHYAGDGHLDPTPQITLTNANAPIKSFGISEDRYTPTGSLFFLEEHPNKILLYTPDAKKFLILTYNYDAYNTSIVCYDKEWNTLWDHTISAIISPNAHDLTTNNFYCAGGNLLYSFNLLNGDYVYAPLEIGECSLLRKTESGVLAIDTASGEITYVNSKGRIAWNTNTYFGSDTILIQIINDKAIIESTGFIAIDCKNQEIIK